MLIAPNLFVHYFYIIFLRLHQNTFKRILKFKKLCEKSINWEFIQYASAFCLLQNLSTKWDETEGEVETAPACRRAYQT